MTLPLIAHKFGGSSVATAERLARVADILLERRERQVVVVSALQGVTDALITLVKRAAARDEGWEGAAASLAERHRDTAKALLGDQAGPMQQRLTEEFKALHELLHAQALVGAVSPDLMELVSGLGEVWSSLMLDACLRARGAPSRWLDARDVLVVEKGELGAMVDWEASGAKLKAFVPDPGDRVVITGFIARTRDGRITTLGRNGSDYSGAIFAALFNAAEVHIWTDVDGVLSADPRLVPEAVLINRLSYSEACELAYFGAKVIHPQTMAPAFERNIPIITRSTFNPTHPGTRISAERDLDQPVKGVTTFSGLAILNIEGAGMIGVPGTAERAFEALKEAGISVVMISQGSSEHSICCVIQERDGHGAERAVREAFARELAAGMIEAVTVTPGVAALAVVGDGMAGTPGVAARLFSALARAGVNVKVIAQGSSERNISVAIDAVNARKGLRAVHSAFYLSAQTLSVGIIGPGNVGKALLAQIAASRERLLTKSNVDLRVRAITGRSKMALGDTQLELSDPRALLEQGVATDLDSFAAHVQADHLPHAIIIDCSAEDSVAARYEGWLAKGIHVVTPNKHAGSGPWARYAALKAQPRARFLYESTVGAGLPIITTLRDLIDTGDEVLSVEGIFSGTLAYLFNRFDGSERFSALVRQAKELGYTEPDPRDDLSGRDVARKLVILARENGWQTKLEDIELESLVPVALRDVPVDAFLSRLEELDGPMQARLESAKKEGRVLRYVAKLEQGGVSKVGLSSLPGDHAFAHIRLTDNVVQFTTKRYRTNPLVVQGPGAGPEVTAAGVFADLLRIATGLGARL
ncbi:MAG: bifunctional aspartate kinase/homoserine dehydrogenase I [Myxococcales bacterium]|nr:bifunctional aspartate kinase/homoserine dehydrogenase I [Myxococcales bacterium]